MLIISSPQFEQHVTPPGHPEGPERAHVFDAVAARWTLKGGRLAAPRQASRDELERVHAPRYLDLIASCAGHAVMLDPDTFTSPESHDVALLAAGAAVEAAAHAVEHHEPAFAFVRPPGHHAEANRAMGFCLFNNVAIAAAAMLARGLQRIAVVDLDVHHGNGTQSMFFSSPNVLYASTHQHPFYPGTGSVTETGRAEGQGFTVNVPMDAGSTDGDYDLVYRAVIGPVLDEYSPQLLLVSAGYDAHERDPLASMRVSRAGYGSLARQLALLAARHGSLALVTEGGYELTALAECLEVTLQEIDNVDHSLPPSPAASPGPVTDRAPRGERAVAAALKALRPFWRSL